MKYINRSIIVLLVLAGFLLSACGGNIPVTGEKVAPSKLEAIEGSDLQRVILTEKAAERIGVETVAASGLEVPYAAVIYDIEGNTWIYTMPEPLTFVRESIVIDRIEGDTAILSESLPSEFNVVTVGVAEIYGTETGVSK
jgi:predicted small secreted protein